MVNPKIKQRAKELGNTKKNSSERASKQSTAAEGGSASKMNSTTMNPHKCTRSLGIINSTTPIEKKSAAENESNDRKSKGGSTTPPHSHKSKSDSSARSKRLERTLTPPSPLPPYATKPPPIGRQKAKKEGKSG